MHESCHPPPFYPPPVPGEPVFVMTFARGKQTAVLVVGVAEGGPDYRRLAFYFAQMEGLIYKYCEFTLSQTSRV